MSCSPSRPHTPREHPTTSSGASGQRHSHPPGCQGLPDSAALKPRPFLFAPLAFTGRPSPELPDSFPATRPPARPLPAPLSGGCQAPCQVCPGVSAATLLPRPPCPPAACWAAPAAGSVGVRIPSTSSRPAAPGLAPPSSNHHRLRPPPQPSAPRLCRRGLGVNPASWAACQQIPSSVLQLWAPCR